jgi:N-acetylglucosamine kinase-like BadF-type ATPase
LAQQVGGGDWAATRQWVYGASRGELGLLARAVAQAAHEGDTDALRILQSAGGELARLALALLKRLGPQPVALAGRVFDLHPAIEAALRAALPAEHIVTHSALPAHHAAARFACRGHGT